MNYSAVSAVSAGDDNCIAEPPAPPPGNQVPAMTGEWPLRSFTELGAHPAAVRNTRQQAQFVLREWGFSALADAWALVISELLTNSPQASHALAQVTTVRLWLLSDKEQVLILVWDALPQPPDPQEVDELSESGRGLQLVGLLSEQWSWYPVAAGGKVVWALCGGAAGGPALSRRLPAPRSTATAPTSIRLI